MFKFDSLFTQTFRQDAGIYARKDFNKFSTIKQDNFFTLSENLDLRHHSNQVDHMSGKILNSKHPSTTFSDLRSKLLSKEVDLLDENLPVSFLCQNSSTPTIAYTSYSRSGNTFLRKYLENSNGTFTGSDADLNYSMHFSL